MRRRFDHVDLRVRSLAEARAFYEVLLPALGFTREANIEGWVQYEAAGVNDVAEFVGVTESPQHVANECRIAFRADSAGEVDRLAAIAVRAGTRNVEGPAYEDARYYAVFFEDPGGNRLEVCYRERDQLPNPLSTSFDVIVQHRFNPRPGDMTMNMPRGKPVPDGMHTVTPHLTCAGAADAIEFYKKAFNAVEMGRMPGPQ